MVVFVAARFVFARALTKVLTRNCDCRSVRQNPFPRG